MIGNLIVDVWLLFGRMFPLPTAPGLREVGKPDRSSPVLITCNFDLTVRKVIKALRRDGVNAWLLVAPTRGLNVWCAAGGGHFTTDTVVSILKTSGIAERVDHRRLILPQLAGAGVNVWSLKERSGWQPRFGPVRIEEFSDFMAGRERWTELAGRQVCFDIKDRLVMGTNLGFSTLVLWFIPMLIASIWLDGFWWRSILLVFALAILNSVLVFRLFGKPGVQKGLSLGVSAGVVFVTLSQLFWSPALGSTIAWAGWIVFLSAYLGYDLPSWSPLWRADTRELILGTRHTHIEIVRDKCIGCTLCAVVCPVNVFARVPETRKYVVADPDGCEACGACVENCPSNAILTNFQSGVCSCPTCTVINGVGVLKPNPRSQEDPSSRPITSRDRCDDGDDSVSPTASTSGTAPSTCGCGPSCGECP